jgi:hypothetical protein
MPVEFVEDTERDGNRGVAPATVRKSRRTGGGRRTMQGMTPGTHARAGWTVPQVILAGLILLMVTALAPLFFADLFVTVNQLLAPWFGWWAWTVPLATEASFVTLYLLGVLLVLRRKPARWLAWAPYPFAAASLWLNIAAARGAVPAMVAHAVLVVAFFTPLLAVKAAVRSLSATEDELKLARALADARQYAMDLLRDRKGAAWRWRPSVGSLLRRQVLTGRLPAAVTLAVGESLAAYGQPWEPAVREWVLGAEGLALSEQAERDARSAAESILRSAPEPAPAAAIEAAAGPVSRARPGRDPAALPKLTAKRARGMSPGELVPYAAALLADVPDPSLRRAMSELHAGKEKAAEALRLARKERLALAR